MMSTGLRLRSAAGLRTLSASARALPESSVWQNLFNRARRQGSSVSTVAPSSRWAALTASITASVDDFTHTSRIWIDALPLYSALVLCSTTAGPDARAEK